MIGSGGRLTLVACVVFCFRSDVCAQWPTDLWLDGGGFWTNRIAVFAKNVSNNELGGFGVAVPLPASAGFDDLRVTDSDGVQLAFSRRECDVVIPVTSKAQGETRYFIYWGNPFAKSIAYNSWSVSADAATTVSVEVGNTERLAVKTIGERAKWAAGTWIYRVPVRIANFSEEPLKEALFRFRLAEATRGTRHPRWMLTFRNESHAADRNGSELVFRHSLDPKSIAVLYVYVGEGERRTIACAEREAEGFLLPNDTGIDDMPKFPSGETVRFAHVGSVELPPEADAGGLSVAKADVASLVFPEQPVNDCRGGFELKLAKNERETLQLAVRSPVECGAFACEPSAPRNSAGDCLEIEPGWAECVFVDAPSAFYVHDTKPWMLMYPHTRHPTSDGWSGWWPDPIAPGTCTRLAARFTKAFRLLVKTSVRTAAGEYHGTLAWKIGGKVVRRDPYVVRVWDFQLPQERSFHATFDVRGLSSQKEREKAYKVLAEYGLDADQSCRTLRFSRNEEGRISCDFSEFDRLTELYFGKWGFACAYFPRNPFYVFGWGRKPFDFMGARAYDEGAVDRSKLRPEYTAAYKEALRLFWEHLKKKGWKDKFVLYISDEPYLDRPEIVAQLKAICDMVHEVDPAIRTYVSTWRWKKEWEGCIDIWGVSASGRFPVEKIAELRRGGSRFWFTTDAQFPLDTPYLASELMFPSIAYFLGVERYECWNCLNFPRDGAWRYGFDRFRPRFGIPGKKDRWVRVPVGDGVLMYPPVDGRTGNMVPTIRIDAIRDGLETYEYLKLLEQVKSPAAIDILARYRDLATVPNPGGKYSKSMLPDPRLFGELREAAGNLLDRYQNVISPCAHEAGR